MSDGLKRLFTSMEDAAEKCLRYSRLARLMFMLEDVLIVSAFVLTVAAVALYLWYGIFYWQLVAAGVASAAVVPVVARLGMRYYSKTFEELHRLEKLAYVAALVMKIDEVTAKLEKEIDDLAQRLKKMGIRRPSED